MTRTHWLGSVLLLLLAVLAGLGIASHRAGVAEETSFLTWARGVAVPADGLASRAPAVEALVGFARVVAIGEPTHGTREVQVFRRELFEWLVREKGFRVLALEANLERCIEIDRHVVSGEGSAIEAVRENGTWVWDTRATVDIVEWARSWNASRGPEERVHVGGIDVQDPCGCADVALTALAIRDPEPARELRSRLEARLGALGERGCLLGLTRDPSVADDLEALSQRLEELEGRRARRDLDELAWAARAARIASRAAREGPARRAERDRAMAENVLWLLERGGPVLVAAHDEHVEAQGDWRMGWHLRRALGPGALLVTSTFESGQFVAVELEGEESTGRMGRFSVAEPPSHFSEALLARVDDRPYLLDMRGATGSAGRWLRRARPTQRAGGGFDPADRHPEVTRALLPAADALLVLGRTTPTRSPVPPE